MCGRVEYVLPLKQGNSLLQTLPLLPLHEIYLVLLQSVVYNRMQLIAYIRGISHALIATATVATRGIMGKYDVVHKAGSTGTSHFSV